MCKRFAISIFSPKVSGGQGDYLSDLIFAAAIWAKKEAINSVCSTSTHTLVGYSSSIANIVSAMSANRSILDCSPATHLP
ncbi:hypothetical protein [Psychrobacter pygoscelis]|uniref:hypothetical protein n=1 Tax=Psychrobacter pygoscelis TaxID=2488563 RepID=UPI00103B7A08|nr:hypothetical protein [Psychrobacter pygoscelis]